MIVVTGAAGNAGGAVVQALTAAGEPVRGVVRDSGHPALPAGAEAVTGDLNEPASLRPALDGADGLFLLPGYPAGILAEASRAGVRRLVQLSGSSAGSDDLDNAITRYMTESEAAARASGLAWTIVRPTAFMANTLRWLPQLRSGDLVRAQFPKVRTAMIDPADIAAVAVRALTSDGHAGKVYEVSGPQALTPAGQVEILGAVLGRPLRCEGQSDEETRAEMSAAMPDEYVRAFFRFYVDGTLDESRVLPTVEEVTGRPPGTLAQWVAAHADAFA